MQFIKLETKEPNSSPRGGWSETGLQFKPHPLQHLHQPIGQHIRTRSHSRSHSTRHRDKVSLLYADDLVLLSPTEEGLQDSLNLLEDFCQSWALMVNLQKNRVMMFQKHSRSQGPTHTFTLSHRTIETTKTCTYLGLKMTSTGNFTLAVKELKEKAQRAFYAIKRSIKIDISIQIWPKFVKSIMKHFF